MALRLRRSTEADRPWLRSLIEQEWGLPVVTPSGAYHTPETQEGVVAEAGGERVGVVTFVRDGADWEVVTVIAIVEGMGVGRAMLEHVRHLAEGSGARRVWLITTDDAGAPAFYERVGMTRTRTLENFVDVVRREKPSTDGYRDAYEFEWRLAGP